MSKLIDLPFVAKNRQALKTVLLNFLKGLGLLGLVLLLKFGIELTPFGQQTETTAYSYLMSSLGFDRTTPIVVLDISQLDMKTTRRGNSILRYTPRSKLREILQALADQRPLAIGIDIDFSPLADDFVNPNEDPAFFDFCKELRNPDQYIIPVYLGVFRQRGLPMSAWLGAEEYQDLAASIAIHGKPGEIIKKMPQWAQIPGSTVQGRTMSAALAAQMADASADLEQSKAKNEHMPWWSRTIERHPGRSREFLVDYSPLSELISSRLRTIDPSVISNQGYRFRGKIVLIGDATCMGVNDTGTDAEDAYLTPG